MFGLPTRTLLLALLCSAIAAVGFGVVHYLNAGNAEKLLSSNALDLIAWYSTLASALICIGFAYMRGLKSNFNLYTALSVFACAWVLVLTAYTAPVQHRSVLEQISIGLATDIAAVLLVYVGELLRADVRVQGGEQKVEVSGVLTAPMTLLLFIALPHAVAVPALLQPWVGSEIVVRDASSIVSQVAVLIGFFALGYGVYAISGKSNIFTIVLVILTGYGIVLTGRVLELLIAHETLPRPAFYVLWISTAKVALTLCFGIAVLTYSRNVITSSPSVMPALWDLQRTILKVLMKHPAVNQSEICAELRASCEAHQKVASSTPGAIHSQAAANALGAMIKELGC